MTHGISSTMNEYPKRHRSKHRYTPLDHENEEPGYMKYERLASSKDQRRQFKRIDRLLGDIFV